MMSSSAAASPSRSAEMRLFTARWMVSRGSSAVSRDGRSDSSPPASTRPGRTAASSGRSTRSAMPAMASPSSVRMPPTSAAGTANCTTGVASSSKVPATIWSRTDRPDRRGGTTGPRCLGEPHRVDQDGVPDPRDQARLLAHGLEHVRDAQPGEQVLVATGPVQHHGVESVDPARSLPLQTHDQVVVARADGRTLRARRGEVAAVRVAAAAPSRPRTPSAPARSRTASGRRPPGPRPGAGRPPPSAGA